MKQIIFTIAVLFTVAFTSCKTDPDHRIRVKNLTTHMISLTIDDSLRIDSVEANAKSAYVPVSEGSHRIGGDYVGNFVVEGNGTVKWTLECYEDKFSLIQE